MVGGDFNIVGFPSEKKNCTRFNKTMLEYSDFIEYMELADPQLARDSFTWKRGERQGSAARLDRFFISEENSFRNIK